MLHKAATPESTVHNVRSILHEQDIFTIEYWVNNRDLPSSVRVNVHDIIPMGTNGKGRNYPFALASGYGEFLERLQNLILFDETSYIGNQDVKPLCHGDSKEYRFSYYRNSHPHTLSSLVNHIELDDLERIFGQSNQKDIEGISFLSLTSGKQVILPSHLIDISIGSNGMCAGNSAPEAIMQGLSEIYERYVLRSIHLDPNICLPVVTDQYLKETSQWAFIEKIRSYGYEVFVKDCSLGGRFPVVGVLLHKDNKALFNLGAAQNFSIALERCISEILQGIQFEQIDDVMKPVVPLHTPIDDNVYSSMEKQLQHQYFSNLICGQGVVPPVVLDHSEPFNVAFLHDSNDLASDEACFIMLKTAKDQELEVYCRDVSFLGFDTYRLYIPGMSEVMMPSLDVIECLTTNLPKARKIFFNLSEATKQEVEFLAQQIEFLNDSPMLQKAGIIETLCGLTFDREAALYTMAPEIVVTLLYYSIGEINRAHESLERYLVHSAQPLSKNDSSVTIQQAIMEHFPDQACLLSFLFFLKENKSIEEISHILKDHYSPEAIASVSSMFTDNEGILSYLNIPNCKDCSVCDYQNICCFPRWQKIFNNFKKTISEKQYDSIAALQKYVI